MKLIPFLLAMAPIAVHASDWKNEHHVDPFYDTDIISSSVKSVNNDGKEITLALQCEKIVRYMESYQKEYDDGYWGESHAENAEYDALSFGLKFKGIEFIKDEPVKVTWRFVWEPTKSDKNGYQPDEYSRVLTPHRVDELIYSDVWKQVGRSIHNADQIELKLESPHVHQVWTIDTPQINQVAGELAKAEKCNALEGRSAFLDVKRKLDLEASVVSLQRSYDAAQEKAGYSEKLAVLNAKRDLLINPPKDVKSELSDINLKIASLENDLEYLETRKADNNSSINRDIKETLEMDTEMGFIETVNRGVKTPQKWQ